MQATTSEGLEQGPYVTARAGAGFEPATLQTKGAESNNESPRPSYKNSIDLVA